MQSELDGVNMIQLEKGCIHLRKRLCKFVLKGQVNIGSIHPKIKQKLAINVQLFHKFLIMLNQIDSSATPNK